MKIELEASNFVDAATFSDDLQLEGNKILASTYHESYQKQVLPSLYLFPNEYFQTDRELAISGLMLKMLSTTEYIAFTLELYGSPFAQDYSLKRSRFYTFLKVKRANIIGYRKNGTINFRAVKIKLSLAFAGRLRESVVPGGMLPQLLVGGALKLTDKAENETIEKDGVLYTLNFMEDGLEKHIDIVVETFFVSVFEQLLSVHWAKEVPEIKVSEKAKEGCFIATACYGDYDHHDVVVLREFRDTVLAKYDAGRRVIGFYYKHSPALANKIANNNQVKRVVRGLFVSPLVKLVSLFSNL